MANQLRSELIGAIHVLNNQGWSNRRIAGQLSIHRETVATHLKLAASSPNRIDGTWNNKESAGRRGPKSKCWELRRVILDRLQQRLSARDIFQTLVAQHGFEGSYASVRRFVARQRHLLKQHASDHHTVCHSWMLDVLQGVKTVKTLQSELGNQDAVVILSNKVITTRLKTRNKALTVLARLKGIANSDIAQFLRVGRKTTNQYFALYMQNGTKGLFARRKKRNQKWQHPRYRDAVISTLHTPPREYGINRTTWKQEDLRHVLREKKGVRMSRKRIRSILKKAGYRWRKARRVLTSNDPAYREKLERISSILSHIGPRERFFSIDEFGPFQITKKPGRKLVAPGENHTVPQYQKSKGSLILTAGLELCTNQVTHFYSEKKNTKEMIRLLDVLLAKYTEMETLYLSWDAASWHISKEFHAKVDQVNQRRDADPKTPRIELAPLPSCAQFLNVIESIFSGMARAIIHNSDYKSEREAMQAIDQYFAERNAAFLKQPKRAGNKIWGKERVLPVFSDSNNCKDPRW